MEKLGKLKKLELEEIKKIWPHEQKYLSPWIAKKINLLNDVLNLQIVIDSTEEKSDNFRMDLAGTEGYSSMPVVIENQFGRSDHDHLGKLITYSAHKEAGIIIWIANEIQPAHRNAVEWLNRITPKEMLFYGIELEVIQIDDSKPAPDFKIVAKPPLEKIIRIRSEGELTPKNKKYLQFFEMFREELLKTTNLFPYKKVWPVNYWTLSIGRSGFFISVSFSRTNQFRIELYIDTGNKNDTKNVFNQLLENRQEVEEKFGNPLIWAPLPEKRACRIYLDKNGTIDDEDDLLKEYIKYAIPLVIKFQKIFTPLVKRIEFTD